MHDKGGRLHLWTRRQVLQQEVVILGEPQINTPQWIVVEWTDAQHSQATVVNVQDILGACEAACLTQGQLWTLVGEGGREDLAGSNVDTDSVDYRPIPFVPDNCVEVYDTRLGQVHLHWLLVEGF